MVLWLDELRRLSSVALLKQELIGDNEVDSSGAIAARECKLIYICCRTPGTLGKTNDTVGHRAQASNGGVYGVSKACDMGIPG